MSSLPFRPPQPALEVRCAGCSETLEVEPGLTEFLCPDCHTPQSLPPELMPRKRKALPLPRGPDPGRIQLPCGSCAAQLIVPHGLGRFACPKCGVELAVDQERLKGYLAGCDVAADVAVVVPCAVRLPLGVDVVAEAPASQINVTHQSFRAPIYTQAPNIEQNYVTTPRAPRVSYIDSEYQNHMSIPSRAPRSSSIDIDSEIREKTPVPSRALGSSSVNTNNICTTIPTSMPPVPCHLSAQQTQEEEEEIAAEEREETVPTPPPSKKAVSKQTKQSKKQSAGPTTKELELSLRRSKRLADSSPATKKKQKSQTPSSQSQPIQIQLSQPSEDTETPLDIARHYNELFPLDNDPLWNPVSPIPDPGSQIPDPNPPLSDPASPIPDPNPSSQIPDPNPGSKIPDPNPGSQIPNPNSDDEGGDEAYGPESDSSQSESEPDSSHEPEPEPEPEPDSSREPEPDSVLQKALKDAQKRRGVNPGKSKKSKKSTSKKSTPKKPTPKKSTAGKRVSSKCLDIWARPDDDPIEIEFNSVGQPIGEMAYALSNFIGSVTRDGKLVPLNYTDWRAVPEKSKDVVWYIVKSKFRMQEENRRFVLKSVGRNWNSWKFRLKKLHYDPHDNDAARLADIDPRIEPEQWPFLVNFWSSDEGQKRSATNKACAAKQKTYHAMGRKSFARIREEERLKRENKEEPCRAEMFILTHTRKDGTPIDEESAQIIARLREELAKAGPNSSKTLKDDILAKVLGKEKHIRTYGLLPARPDNWAPRDSEERARIVSEAKKMADEQARPMKDQMEAMEKRHQEMENEMRLMRQAMLAMQGIVPPGFGGNLQGGDGECGGLDRGGSSSR